MKQDDPLDDFERREITLDGVTKAVHVAGAGPAVIVMTEMPGISPHVARFARWVRDAGFTVYMPSLFGRDGAVPDVEEGIAVFQRACVSAEFRAFAANESSPVTQWLRALARLAHAGVRRPGRRRDRHVLHRQLRAVDDARARDARAGAVPAVAAARRSGRHADRPDELAAVRARLEREDLTVMAYRFEGDTFCRRSASPPTQRRSATASSGACCPTARPTRSSRRSSSTS